MKNAWERFIRYVIRWLTSLKPLCKKVLGVIRSFLAKPILIAILAFFLDQLWHSKQAWYADMPIAGYAFEQKQLQDYYTKHNNKSAVFIVDISMALPSLETGLQASGTTTDTDEEQSQNYKGLGNLIEAIAGCKPKAIVIDWDIAPASADVKKKNKKILFKKQQVELFSRIKKVVTETPVFFGADRASARSAVELCYPEPSLAKYAVSVASAGPSIGPYYATGRTAPQGNLTPLAVAVARLLKKSSSNGDVWRDSEFPGVSSLFLLRNSVPETYWVNYESAPQMIREAFEFSALTDNRPGFDETNSNDRKAMKLLKDKVVVIGDLQRPTGNDVTTFPLSDMCYQDPRRFLGQTFESNEDTRQLRQQIGISASAGVLYQAAAIHTLVERHLYASSSIGADICFALLWSFLWSIITTLISKWFLNRMHVRNQKSPVAEIYKLAVDLMFGTALSAFCLLKLAGLISIHRIIAPIVPVIVIASIGEAVINILYLLFTRWFLVWRRHNRRPGSQSSRPDEAPQVPATKPDEAPQVTVIKPDEAPPVPATKPDEAPQVPATKSENH